jgi:transcriptional regulator with XRE-family HTH domain
MTSFDFDVPEKDMAGAEHVMRVGRRLVAAFVRKAREEHITKAELARRLDLDKASVSRMLRGNANLTLRSVGELCWALGVSPDQISEDLPAVERQNMPRIDVTSPAGTATYSPQRVQVFAQ